MLAFEEARTRVLERFQVLEAEQIALGDGLGRVLAQDVVSRITQPPAAVSSMDGYAVRAADLAPVPAMLRVVGESAAGKGFSGAIGPGEAARIFTGAPLPAGADTVVMQEDARREGDAVTLLVAKPAGSHVRPAGLDFSSGEALLKAGRQLTARDIGLAAAMNVPWLKVRRPPRVAVLATGDELAMPGEPLGPAGIVSSVGPMLGAMIRALGGLPLDLGIARDSEASLHAALTGARNADLLVTIGGASVGDHDLVGKVLRERGLELTFWKVAMRPGKPLIFGRLGDVPVLGLPGNPVSAGVTALLFVRPAIRKMLGLSIDDRTRTARLGADVPANDARRDFLRATLATGPEGELVAMPFPVQDSAMLSILAAADCLVVRAPGASPARLGDRVEIVMLGEAGLSL